MKRIGIITLYDNHDIDFDAYKEDYLNLNEDEDDSVSDNVIWDYINDCLDMEWEDLKSNLKYSSFNDKPCVILGSLGLWNGTYEIEAVVCDTIMAAINKCANNMDYIIIKQNNGHIEVEGIHHDGCNCFEIHLLNKRGVEANERLKYGNGNADLSNKCYHKAIKGYIF